MSSAGRDARECVDGAFRWLTIKLGLSNLRQGLKIEVCTSAAFARQAQLEQVCVMQQLHRSDSLSVWCLATVEVGARARAAAARDQSESSEKSDSRNTKRVAPTCGRFEGQLTFALATEREL